MGCEVETVGVCEGNEPYVGCGGSELRGIMGTKGEILAQLKLMAKLTLSSMQSGFHTNETKGVCGEKK